MDYEAANSLTAWGGMHAPLRTVRLAKGFGGEVHCSIGEVVPGIGLTEEQVMEFESLIASGAFRADNHGLAAKAAVEARRQARQEGEARRPNMLFIRQLEKLADKLERLASASA